MASEFTSSSAWLRSVVRLFTSQGVDPNALFAEAGVDIKRLEEPHERFASDDISRLWEIAVRVSGNPTLGLDRQLARRYMKFEIASQAMSSGPTLLDGLEGFTHYLALIGDSAAFMRYGSAAGFS